MHTNKVLQEIACLRLAAAPEVKTETETTSTRRRTRCPSDQRHLSVKQAGRTQIKMAAFLLRTVCQIVCLTLLMPRACLPTSNINTVWLPSDVQPGQAPTAPLEKRSALLASGPTSSKLQRANDHIRPKPSGARPATTAQRTEQTGERYLQASPSSLQPSIVSLDPVETNNNERRSDEENLHNSDDQLTGDRAHLWNASHLASNDQVQFDEEHQQQGSSRPAVPGSHSLRRHNRHNATTLAPHYDMAPLSAPSVSGLDEYPPAQKARIDSSSPPLTAIVGSLEEYSTNKLDHLSTTNRTGGYAESRRGERRRNSSHPVLYYMPDGNQANDNRWNPSSLSGEALLELPVSSDHLATNPIGLQQGSSGPRRSVHSSGTHYHHREHQVGAGSPAHSSTHHLLDQIAGPPDEADPTSYSLLQETGRPTRKRPADYSVEQLDQATDYHQERPTSSQFGSVAHPIEHGEDKQPTTRLHNNALFRTSPMPLTSPSYLGQQPNSLSYQSTSGTSLLGPRLVRHPARQRPAPRLVLGEQPYVKQRTEAAVTRLASQQRQASVQKFQMQPTEPEEDPGRPLKRINGANNGGMFGYIRLQPSPARPTSVGKKSLLGALSNRLNHWVDASRSQNLESSFYENPRDSHHQQLLPSAIRRLRASQMAAAAAAAQSAAHWNAANYYHIQDNSRPAPVSLASNLPIGHTAHSTGYQNAERANHQFGGFAQATTGFVRPVSAGFGNSLNTDHYGHSLIRPSLNYYPSLNGHGSHGNYMNGFRSVSIQQPTVAPAPSSLLERFYGTSGNSFYPASFTGAGQQHQRRRQRPIASLVDDEHLATNFHHHQLGKKAVSESGIHQQQAPPGFIPVVAVSVTKTSPAPKPALKLYQSLGGDPGSDAASSEIERYLSLKQLQASQNGAAEHDYGNLASGSVLSQQENHSRRTRLANGGLNQRQHADPTESPANEQTTTVKSAVFGYLPNHPVVNTSPLLRAINILPQYAPPPSRFANSHVASASDVYANQEAPLTTGEQTPAPLEEPPSLALQLQANSFVQNEIAHPFIEANSFGQLKGYASSSPAGTHYQYVDRTSPLDMYSGSPDVHHYQTAYLNPLIGTHGSHHLMAAASDLNQHLLPVVFANPDSVRQFPQVTLNTLPGHTGKLSADTVPDESSPSAVTTPASATSSVLNKGNKKRSSEFFASAGQLLISALPLLLAPTLGLMFAGSPNPVARYHAAGSLGPSSSSGFANGGNGIPGSYINSLNSGLVSNASPAPKLFTPTPPNYLMGSTPVSAKASANRSSTTTRAPVGAAKNKTMQGPGSPQKLTPVLELTTLGPPPLDSKSANGGDHPLMSNQTITTFGQTISGPAIVLLADNVDPQDQATFGSADSAKIKGHQYKIGGFEGADYDAQFASLKRKQQQKRRHQYLTSGHSNISDYGYHLDKNVLSLQPSATSKGSAARHKNRYHYSEVVTSPEIITVPSLEVSPNRSRLRSNSTSSSSSMDSNSNSSSNRNLNDQDDEVSTKLYPVSTWPPMRRRTVSLVTSNGNKTLLDASEKYTGFGMYGASPHMMQIASQARRNSPEVNAKSNTSHSYHAHKADSAMSNPRLRNSSADLGRRADSVDFVLTTDDAGNIATLSLADEQDDLDRAGAARRSKRDVATSGDLAAAASSNSIGDAPPFNSQKKSRLPKKPKRLSSKVKLMQAKGRSELSSQPPDSLLANTSLADYEPNSASYQDQDRPGDHSTTSAAVEPPQEPLRSDASKSKSAHIITTMIQQVDDPNEPDEERKPAEQNDDYQGSAGSINEKGTSDLVKDQLLEKKVILEKMAKKHPRGSQQQQPQPAQQHQQQVAGESHQTPFEPNDFSAGGRGRFPPSPVHYHSSQVKLYSNGSAVEQSNRNAPFRPMKVRQHLTLTDDTKRALVNLSSLLMKDSLQHDDADQNQSQNRHWKEPRRPLGGDKHDRRRNYASGAKVPPPREEERYELYEGSATERSESMTTPFPATSYGPVGDEPSYQSPVEMDWQREAPTYHSKIPAPIRRTTYPPSISYSNASDNDYNMHGSGSRHNHMNQSMMGNQQNPHDRPSHQMGEFAALSGARDRVNLIEPELVPYGPSDERSMSEFNGVGHGLGTYAAQDGKYGGERPTSDRYKPESPVGQYMYAMNHSSGSNRSATESEQAYGGYSNHSDRQSEQTGPYSRPPDQYMGAYSNAHYSDPSRRQQPQPQPQHQHQHQQQHQRPYGGYDHSMRNYPPNRDDRYSIGGETAPQNHHYNGTTYAPMYHNHKPASHYNHQAHPMSYNHEQDYTNSPYHPSSMYGSDQQQHHHTPPPLPLQPPLHTHSHSHPPLPPPAPPLPPSMYNRYSPTDSRYPLRPLEYRAPQREYYPAKHNRNTQYKIDPSPFGSPSASAVPYQGTSVAPFGEKSDSRAVNEYLKRVQFTDSDRDKLMAR